MIFIFKVSALTFNLGYVRWVKSTSDEERSSKFFVEQPIAALALAPQI
jgi:hypothetical protein